MVTLKEELASIETKIAALEARKRELYRESVAAPEHAKLCQDHIAGMLADPDLFDRKWAPFEVTGIKFTGALVEGARKAQGPVGIRPCDPELENKTFLGVYLGDYASTVSCGHNRETGVLEVSLSGHNPAIWVPSLQRIVFGRESWWYRLENEEQLAAISDEGIDGIWYVQAMRALMGAKGRAHAQG